ncbi:MAG: prephenate dehydratase [Bacteroidia bacterium]|nr:prephenate dehydratase [Bacteroidia bacterium]
MHQVLQATKPIAIQGVQGSFHEIAAKKYFGNEIELEMCDSFPGLFQAMESGRSSFGVVAIENTVAGTILPNYALLRNSNYKVIGEVYLRIEHQLLGLKGSTIETLEEVYSHPMAINQCRHFFRSYPQIKLISADDTAASAARLAQSQTKGQAAIASRLAAETYELEILAESIEDNKRNFTRFLIITDDMDFLAKQEEINKASISFIVAHKVGHLSQILQVLSAYDMSLSKIQSSPIVGQEWQYFFHVDLEFDDYERFRQSLNAINPLLSELKVLGEYPKGDKNVS